MLGILWAEAEDMYDHRVYWRTKSVELTEEISQYIVICQPEYQVSIVRSEGSIRERYAAEDHSDLHTHIWPAYLLWPTYSPWHTYFIITCFSYASLHCSAEQFRFLKSPRLKVYITLSAEINKSLIWRQIWVTWRTKSRAIVGLFSPYPFPHQY